VVSSFDAAGELHQVRGLLTNRLLGGLQGSGEGGMIFGAVGLAGFEGQKILSPMMFSHLVAQGFGREFQDRFGEIVGFHLLGLPVRCSVA